MTKKQAKAILANFASVDTGLIRRQHVRHADGFIISLNCALICKDGAAISSALASYELELAIAFS